MDPDSKRLSVSVTDGRGRRVGDGGLGRWLESVAPTGARGEVGIALATDARVRALNRQYRRQNRPTDVLSFPAGNTNIAGRGRQRSSPEPRGLSAEFRLLGDIVISMGVARRQARDAGHSEQTELRVLALHGLLHLLGYDHHDRSDRRRMARVEARLRAKGGLAGGLIERAARGDAARGTHE